MRSGIILFMILCLANFSAAQNVGINETGNVPNASAILDVDAADKGILIPRVELQATNSNLPIGASVTVSLLVYNTTPNGAGATAVFPGFYYWGGSNWIRLADDSPRTFIGKFIITGTGAINITGIPFEPSSVKFEAYGNVGGNIAGYNVNADNSVGNNNNGIANSFNYMTGYATNYGAIDQQVICGGGHGNSINDITRYASSTDCIGIRYGNQNGDFLGSTRGQLTSFNSDGFSLNITNFGTRTIVIFTAFR